jgi:hypothetical protein
MSVYQNGKNMLSVLLLAGADKTVMSTFGGYEEAAAAQADLNTLGAIMDSGVTTRKWSRRKAQTITLDDLIRVEDSTEVDMTK